jgi:hypothetical protein
MMHEAEAKVLEKLAAAGAAVAAVAAGVVGGVAAVTVKAPAAALELVGAEPQALSRRGWVSARKVSASRWLPVQL